MVTLLDSPADLSSEEAVYAASGYWSVDSTRDNYKQADGKYHFTQDFINGILSHYFRTGSFTFDITQCRNYDASEGTAVIENVSGFGGRPGSAHCGYCRCWKDSTVQVTADFYNANPFFDSSGGELPLRAQGLHAGLLPRRRAVPVGTLRTASRRGRSACGPAAAHRRNDGRSGAAAFWTGDMPERESAGQFAGR
ncbi:MAG: hypothetical protein ACLU3I_21945 [Acutalibacteraceae bacterium]